jgi:hypothetical protein
VPSVPCFVLDGTGNAKGGQGRTRHKHKPRTEQAITPLTTAQTQGGNQASPRTSADEFCGLQAQCGPSGSHVTEASTMGSCLMITTAPFHGLPVRTSTLGRLCHSQSEPRLWCFLVMCSWLLC